MTSWRQILSWREEPIPLYVIRYIGTGRGGFEESLYWNNQFGWVDREQADIFTKKEINMANLPLGGTWEAA